LGLTGFDFDSLIEFLENGEDIQLLEFLDNSIDRIINQEPDADFGDEEIQVNGEHIMLNDYFVGLNASFDADILYTLMGISKEYPAEEYPELYKQEGGGRKSRRRKTNKKTNKKTQRC
jgi:hypothetical protein